MVLLNDAMNRNDVVDSTLYTVFLFIKSEKHP